MDEAALCRQQPHDIDETISCMRATLEHFHASNDKRAIFLRLYYVMTLEVHAAITRRGEYEKRTVFLDPAWIRRLSGRFSSMYFASLDTADRPGRASAWKTAYRVAATPGSTVIENALLGINAHINYDLPRAIAANLEPGDLDSYTVMQRRKFDHDQVNNLLIRVLEPIQRILARDYEPGIAMADLLMGRLDERMSRYALKHYRERVWWDSLAFAAAQEQGKDDVVRGKLDWEAGTLADALLDPKMLWTTERALNRFAGFRTTSGSAKSWADLVLEEHGGDFPVSWKERPPRATVFDRPNPLRLLARLRRPDGRAQPPK